MKSNDNIPEDEMLLAEAIAAAKARGMGWTSGVAFRDSTGRRTEDVGSAASCCAIGALVLAGELDSGNVFASAIPRQIDDVVEGNDTDDRFLLSAHDRGESLGWAFRCAMTQEDA